MYVCVSLFVRQSLSVCLAVCVCVCVEGGEDGFRAVKLVKGSLWLHLWDRTYCAMRTQTHVKDAEIRQARGKHEWNQ